MMGTKSETGCFMTSPTVTLSNDVELPLIGLGVGNLQANRVETMIYEAIKSDNRIRLIDTSQTSSNEKEVGRGIIAGVKRFKDDANVEEQRLQVHVITKIWHTHLGYERTRLAVKESLKNFGPALKEKNVDLKLHVLIHQPRCIDGQDQLSCEHQEIQLPNKVRKAGPAPYLDKKNSWKASWKALEDMYSSGDYPSLASIGVSNFSVDELKNLLAISSVKPHLVQTNITSLVQDPLLIHLCKENNIHIQVFNVMTNLLLKAPATPHAHHSVQIVANMLSKRTQENIKVTPVQAVLRWLLQLEISSIPRTQDLNHLMENSAMEVSKVPPLSANEKKVVSQAVDAVLRGIDLEQELYTEITIHAGNQDIFVYAYGEKVEDQKHVAYIGKGDSFKGTTHPGYTYRAYNAYDPNIYKDYTADSISGDRLHIDVKL